MASSVTSSIEKSDPVLLGVSLPLGLTVNAAKQVGAAWKDAGVHLVEALSHVRDEAKAKASKKLSDKKDELEGTAAAAAGVSA